MDVVGATEEFHWHDFDTIVYIMSGKAAAEYENGNVLTAGPGHVAHLPVGIVHRDVPGVTFRGVFGFSVDPSSMANPVNKPLDQLPGAAE